MKKIKCNSKDDLIKLMKIWLEANEQTIGNGENNVGNEKWIFLTVFRNKYFINADTTREGVEIFVNNNEEDFPWKVITNNRGIYKKVSNDKNGFPIPGLYFNSSKEGQREL